jgi:3'-5' exoribonuclease 1
MGEQDKWIRIGRKPGKARLDLARGDKKIVEQPNIISQFSGFFEGLELEEEDSEETPHEHNNTENADHVDSANDYSTLEGKQKNKAHFGVATYMTFQIELSRVPSYLNPSDEDQSLQRQPCRYYVIIDFEATCDENMGFAYANEIIEFPAILLDTMDNRVTSVFHSFVRPRKNSTLTPYCIELTGISQDQVDQSEDFVTVYRHFKAWMKQYGLRASPTGNTAFITDGPWDLRDFLRKQCDISGIHPISWFNQWVNLRRAFRYFYFLRKNLPAIDPVNLDSMLEYLGWSFEGHKHSGLDDSFNITRIVLRMIRDGCKMRINEEFGKSMQALRKYKEKHLSREENTLPHANGT